MAIGIVIGNDKLLEVIVVLSCSVSSTISYGLIGIYYYLLNWIISFNYNFLYTLLIFFTFEKILHVHMYFAFYWIGYVTYFILNILITLIELDYIRKLSL